MGNGSHSVRFKVKPASYPLIKVLLNSQGENEHDQLETEVTFPREFWVTLADNCRNVAHSMGAFSSTKIVTALNLMCQNIMSEIEAEDRRMKFKDAYESLVDFVFEISGRTDLDKVRKGQLIHDKVRGYQLQP